jgi:hypothetical protein
MMSYLTFTFWFTIIHTVAYISAGIIALKISKDIYESKERYADFLRDMGDPTESKHVQKTFIPAQIVRGIIMSLVLYPVLGALGELSFLARFFFFAGLMIVYTEISSAVPFPTNIEGFVYMKQKYMQGKKIWKFWLEIIIYSVIFALPTAGLLF